MDENKLEKLRSLSYTIKKCCGNCQHIRITPNAMWGTCRIHDYVHNKHRGGAKTEIRELSTNKYGFCEAYEMRDTFLLFNNPFKEFLE